jgi:hypothetical protein
MRSGRKADVASTRLYSSEATVIYNEVAPTALLKSEMRPVTGQLWLVCALMRHNKKNFAIGRSRPD